MREGQREQYAQQILDKRKRRRKLGLSFVGIVLIIFSLVIYAYYSLAYQPFYFNQIITTRSLTPIDTPSPTPTFESAVTPTPTATSVPTATAIASATPDPLKDEVVLHTSISNIRGIVILPYNVEKNRSIDVNVTLISRKNVQLVLTDTPRGTNQGTTGGLIPLGSPDVPIVNSYGVEYTEVFAVAILNLPWILDYIQKRQEAKGKKHAPSSNRSRRKTRRR